MATSKAGLVRYAAVAVVSLACAWQAYTFALVPNLRLSSPVLALQYRPDDAVAISKRVHAGIEEAGKYASTEQDRRDAISALIETPLNRSLLRIIGMDAALRGDKAQAAEFLTLSHQVSRRDIWTEVWLLEEAARADDFPAVLSHYHAALAVNPELAPSLNPLMVDATAYPQVRVALRPYLRRDASWAPGYLAAAAKDAQLDHVMDLIGPVAHLLGDEAYEPGVSRILFRLGAAGRSGEAMRLAKSVWPDFEPAAFARSLPDPASSDARLGSLAWTLGESTGLAPRLVQSGGIEAILAPLARGVIASRDMPVTSGSEYALVQRIDFTGEWQSARIRWYAECFAADGSAGGRIWEQVVPAASKAITYRSTITVPSGCSLLKLTLAGNGPDGRAEAGFRLNELSLSKVR